MKILVVENLPEPETPWWLEYLPPLPADVQLTFAHVLESGQTRWQIVRQLWRLRQRVNSYDVVITMQDSHATFFLGVLNALWPRKRYRHIVNEFITRELDDTLYSRLKYRFLRFALSSVDAFHCSARGELAYYRRTLRLSRPRFRYIPLATNPKFLDWPQSARYGEIVSAGRTGRDYATLLEAAQGENVRVTIVADPKNLEGLHIPDNVQVLYNIPQTQLATLMSQASFVVIPLQDRLISVGQSVILIAMALGRAVITTRVHAVSAYVRHEHTGLLVPPHDPLALRRAMHRLVNDPGLADGLGQAGRQWVARRFVPSVSAPRVCASARSLVAGEGRSRPYP